MEANKAPTESQAGKQHLLNTAEAAAYLRLKKATLENYRTFGGGPSFIKTPGRVYYLIEDLDAWLRSRRVRSTSEYPARDAARELAGAAA